MPWYNGEFIQRLSVLIKTNDHHTCLQVANFIKKQCDAWAFNVEYIERKSARKGAVLRRELVITQTAHASDILIFREAIRRVYNHIKFHRDDVEVMFNDRGAEPVNNLRNQP